MIPFRLYYLDGCNYCKRALDLLTTEQIPFQRVDITNDPIASEGIKAVLNTDIIPVFVAFGTKELVKGFNAKEYHRLIAAYRSAGELNMVTGAEPNTIPPSLQTPPEAI